MKADLKLQEPTKEIEISFINYIKYDVNGKRIAAGLEPIDYTSAILYLRLSWDFANRFGDLKSAST